MRLDAELLKKTGIFALVSSELIATIGGGYLLGTFLDERFNTAPVFVGIFTTAGLSYGVWRISKISKHWMAK